MSILIDGNTRVIVQGITGRDGSFHASSMKEYGTKVVGGVTPGKGGILANGVPVFDSIKEAVAATGADASVIFVPAKFASAAIREAADGGIDLVICITEGIPVQEMIENYHYVKARHKRLIGPNCPGLITPGKCKIGIMPGPIHLPGRIGVISRSGTLTYEVVYALTKAGIGQSTCIGIGGDPIIGTGFTEILEMFEKDPGTDGVVLIGEIGGDEEAKAAEFIKAKFSKKVVVFISGRTAPPGKRMGHAGALISGAGETAEAKVKAFRDIGVPVADRPDEIPGALSQ
ncbi:MAG: succinate--CoA ligase subunit alpha [Treponema sp. RIFOXYC1_FULL_61_9]|nr:MAG: succinate--CoA ligase subunit alpha [Treponema sp. RIFOXYC1_FULL_61_9]